MNEAVVFLGSLAVVLAVALAVAAIGFVFCEWLIERRRRRAAKAEVDRILFRH